MFVDPVVDTTMPAGRYSREKSAMSFDEHLKEERMVNSKNELQAYITSPCEPKSATFDLLSWWKRNATIYPVLSIMARDILAIPVSTVASESAFSTGGRVIETFRSSLKVEMTEALICAQQWLKPTMSSFKDINLVEEVDLSEEIILGTVFL
jgi:hypothetical protein